MVGEPGDRLLFGLGRVTVSVLLLLLQVMLPLRSTPALTHVGWRTQAAHLLECHDAVAIGVKVLESWVLILWNLRIRLHVVLDVYARESLET